MLMNEALALLQVVHVHLVSSTHCRLRPPQGVLMGSNHLEAGPSILIATLYQPRHLRPTGLPLMWLKT